MISTLRKCQIYKSMDWNECITYRTEAIWIGARSNLSRWGKETIVFTIDLKAGCSHYLTIYALFTMVELPAKWNENNL